MERSDYTIPTTLLAAVIEALKRPTAGEGLANHRPLARKLMLLIEAQNQTRPAMSLEDQAQMKRLMDETREWIQTTGVEV